MNFLTKPAHNVRPELDMKRVLSLAFFFPLLLLFIVACGSPVVEQAVLGYQPGSDGNLELDLIPYASGFNNPVSIANAGDDRLFIVEKAGIIRIIDAGGTVLPTPFIDITGRVDSSASEEGLLGLVFHPNYDTNGYFYVNYTNTTSSIRRSRISRFSVTGDPNIADPNSEDILLTVTQPYGNHNAGDIHFGPDGYLYIPLGDGGSSGDPGNNAQILSNLLGMVSRIDVDSGPGAAPECPGIGSGNYTIPAGNPFADGAGANCDEIWAAGLRNPWRSSFDRQTGDLWIADVGQNLWEEVNFRPAGSGGGENYGWSCYEGNHVYNQGRCDGGITYTFPVFEYSHNPNNCSVTGGYVYRGSQFPGMVERYFLTDYCSGRFWDLEPDGQGGWTATRHDNLQRFGLTTFGEAADGELYLAQSNGTIYHLEAVVSATPTPTPTSTATATPTSTATATATATATVGVTPFGTPSHLPLIINGEQE
jgi:glucose/arabinose dehydrogenase